MLQNSEGQILPTHSVSAGLDYPGVGPEHAFYQWSGRAKYVAVTYREALEGFQLLSRQEGLIPALESAHAVAALPRLARQVGRKGRIILCLSGRGDKDAAEVRRILENRSPAS